MRRYIRTLFSVLLILIFFVGCVPKNEFIEENKLGLHPNAQDFPNTKWTCQELNLTFCMLDYGSDVVVGNCIFKGKTYRVVGSFGISNEFDFNFFDYSNSSYPNSPTPCACVYTEYKYENDIMTCTINSATGLNIEQTVLNFKKTDVVFKKMSCSFKCDSVNLQLNSYSDIDSCYKGEIVIDNKKCGVLAYQLSNNYYCFLIENGKLNNLTSGTYSLVDMIFEHTEDKIIAKIPNECISNKVDYPYWNHKETTLIFKKQQ